MRFVAIAAGFAFAVSTMSVVGPAWAQTRLPNPEGAPIGGGGSGGPAPNSPTLHNSSGKCWINTDGTNYQWGDCPQVSQPQRGAPRR